MIQILMALGFLAYFYAIWKSADSLWTRFEKYRNQKKLNKQFKQTERFRHDLIRGSVQPDDVSSGPEFDWDPDWNWCSRDNHYGPASREGDVQGS